ncbi:MAG: hypothetical protein PGN12_09430 [Sphingomonas phyllosphaerae]
MILIVSHPDDVHARAVIAEIAGAGGSARILNLSDFPCRAHLTMTMDGVADPALSMRWPDDGETLDFDAVGAVWWRRPQPFRLHPELADPGYGSFAAGECGDAIAGLWHLLDAEWINPPLWDERAHRKPLQLKLARECGLTVPATCMTSDPDAAAAFIAQHAGQALIYKAFGGTEADWRETRLLRPEQTGDLSAFRFAPLILQAFVPARYDVRLTIVGEELFAAAIHSQQSRYPLDFRMDVLNTAITPIDVPEEVRTAMMALMRTLRIVYGAADFRVTDNDEWVFLEVNPAGQWLFVEDATGQPIARALAHRLIEADRTTQSPRA